MKTHELKTWPRYFEAVKQGLKTFEIRNNDRNFEAGDEVRLQEWDRDTGNYTGRVYAALIGYVTDFDQKPGFVVFSLIPMGTKPAGINAAFPCKLCEEIDLAGFPEHKCKGKK